MAETFANQAASTLSAAITTTTATSCTVTDATTFPTTGNFRIKIDGEILLVTAVAGSTFTVTRAQEGTVAATHANLAPVIHLLTKGSMEARVANRFISDLYANKPVAAVPGRLFFPTDGLFIEYDDGAAWHKYGPYRRLKSPPQTGWTWINQGNATATFTSGALILEDPDLDTNTTQLRMYMRPIGAGLPRITAGFMYNGLAAGSQAPNMGICGYTTGGADAGNIKCLGIYMTGTGNEPYMCAKNWTTYGGTAETGYNIDGNYLWPFRIFWIRWELVGKNDTISYSNDGVNWIVWHNTIAFGTYNAPVQWGIYVDPVNNVAPVAMTLVHWEES